MCASKGHCGTSSTKDYGFVYLYFMPVRKAITEKDGVYSITFTCTNNSLPLFKICNAYYAVYNWFDKLKEHGHYVIMPSHVHVIVAFSNTCKSINSIVSNGKRFIVYDLVTGLKN